MNDATSILPECSNGFLEQLLQLSENAQSIVELELALFQGGIPLVNVTDRIACCIGWRGLVLYTGSEISDGLPHSEH